GPDAPGPGRSRPERSESPKRPPDGATRNGASCCTFFVWWITIELAEQGIAVFLGPVGQVGDEGLDLLTGSFAEGFGAAEVDGVGLDEVGIELMLADQLAEAVADFGSAIVSVFAVYSLGRKPFRLPGRRSGFGQ